MAEFIEVAAQWERMCESYKDCFGCPMEKDIQHAHVPCHQYVRKYPCTAMNSILNWAKENPEPQYPSWGDWWEETFPNSNAGGKEFCPKIVNRNFECLTTNELPDCEKCVKQTIPDDIAIQFRVEKRNVGGNHEG